ncbi:MAG: amylo-alpha-1,6-glucosidase [Hyphomicrobiales bacterium]|nr:amylo-alpha-1,6-glucosidase [Hyphomicrobiales bacterium]
MRAEAPRSQTEGALPATDALAEAPFYIPSTSPSARPRRTLKHADTFAVFDSHGDMGASAGGPDGLFNHDTRFLSRLELLIGGTQPLLLGSSIRDDNVTLSVDLTNADIFEGGHIVLQRDTIHVVRTVYLWRGVAYQRIAVSNHGDDRVSFNLTLLFGNDFADIFEVRGQLRPKRGHAHDELRGEAGVSLIYRGLDGATRRSELTFEPAPTRRSTSTATYELSLEAGESCSLFFTVECHGAQSPNREGFFRGLRKANRERRRGAATTIETSNEVLNEALRRSMADLHMLTTRTVEGPYPYAGTPWFSTTFGRDGIITALQMLWFDPSVAKGVLLRLADYQATTTDDSSDAQPGKILHEMRGGEMAALKEVPFGLYYGSVDSTPLFVILAGLYTDRTGDLATLRQLWPAIKRALHWMHTAGDPDGDGFLEYGKKGIHSLKTGLQHQGWKDSFDAVFHADGRLAQGPIALAEVQGYAYAAKRAAASCAHRLGENDLAQELERSAERLADRFDACFWSDDLELYVLGLDGDKTPLQVRASNAGQLLWTGIARPERARKVGEAMVSPAFFSGWGVRTVAKGEARYNPMSYHNGSIWPHDNSLIAWGLARYGLMGQAQRVFEANFAAASYMDLRRLPELFCGFRRRRGAGPTLYPVACTPQAWASGALFLMIQASLGLEFDPAAKEIRFRNPTLPAFVDQIVLRRAGFVGAEVDVALRRIAGHVSLRVLRNSGQAKVTMILADRPA